MGPHVNCLEVQKTTVLFGGGWKKWCKNAVGCRKCLLWGEKNTMRVTVTNQFHGLIKGWGEGLNQFLCL